MDDSEKLAT